MQLLRRTVRGTILYAIIISMILITGAVPAFAADAGGSAFIDMHVDTSFAEKALITFHAPDDADGYFLTATETGGRRHAVSSWVRKSRDEEKGLYRTLLQGLRPDTEYTLEITSVREGGERRVHPTGVTFRTCPLPDEAPDHQPISYLDHVTDVDRRTGTFTAVITTLKTPGLMYEASIVFDPTSRQDRTYPTIIPLGESTAIKGLNRSSEITIRHGKTTEAGILWSGLTTKMTFPRNIDRYDENFILEENDGVFSWSGLERGRTVTLYRHTSSGGSMPVETVEAETSGTFSYRDGYSLESALYFASSGDAVSRPVFYTAGPDIRVEKDQQNIKLSWKEPEGVRIAYSGIMTPARDRYGNVTLHISALESNTEYPFSVKANFADGRTAETSFTVKTDSFEGVYEWRDPADSPKSVPSFAVTVKEAPSDSEYGYYIYTNARDPKCIEDGGFHEERLMPLYDTSLGEKEPDGFIPFKSGDAQTSSYRWNEGKWNKGSLHPNGWMPVSMEVSQDKYESVVKSKAAFGVKVDTRTVFEFFIGDDGTPMLRFMNRAEGSNSGLANGALFKNVAPVTKYGEDEFTYCLTRISGI